MVVAHYFLADVMSHMATDFCHLAFVKSQVAEVSRQNVGQTIRYGRFEAKRLYASLSAEDWSSEQTALP